MKYWVIVFITAFLSTPYVNAHAQEEHSFRVFASAGYGTERQQFFARGSSYTNNEMLFGTGISYALYLRKGTKRLLNTIDVNIALSFTPYGFMIIDIYAGYGVGFISKGGRFTFDVIGLGATVTPIYKSLYEYAQTTPPFNYIKGDLSKTANVGVLINILGFQYTAPEPYGFYIAWRNFVSVNVYNGGQITADKTASSLGVPSVNYDNLVWDAAFRTTLLIGFDFISINRKYRGSDLDRRIRVK